MTKQKKGNRGGSRTGSGRKPTGEAGKPCLITLSPRSAVIYAAQPPGNKGAWVSRLIVLNADAVIEPGTSVRPVGGVGTGVVVFSDSREVVVRWPSGLRVHQMDEVERLPTLMETVEVEW